MGDFSEHVDNLKGLDVNRTYELISLKSLKSIGESPIISALSGVRRNAARVWL
jgi:hypothetical protein